MPDCSSSRQNGCLKFVYHQIGIIRQDNFTNRGCEPKFAFIYWNTNSPCWGAYCGRKPARSRHVRFLYWH